MTTRLEKTLELNRAALAFERAHPPVVDLVCIMCVRPAPPGQQRCQVCGGTLLVDHDMGAGFNP